MKAHQFYTKLINILTEKGKGDSEITFRYKGYRIPLDQVIWCDACEEFHITEKLTEEELLQDKHNKSWLN